MTLPISAYPEPRKAVTEDDLMRSIVSVKEARPCLCGGVVVAYYEDPTEGLREHQATQQHADWRRRHGL